MELALYLADKTLGTAEFSVVRRAVEDEGSNNTPAWADRKAYVNLNKGQDFSGFNSEGAARYWGAIAPKLKALLSDFSLTWMLNEIDNERLKLECDQGQTAAAIAYSTCRILRNLKEWPDPEVAESEVQHKSGNSDRTPEHRGK